MAFQDTYIGELSGSASAPTIAHHLKVPLDDKSVKEYMLEPESGMNNTISTKIKIHTNNKIKRYLANPKLQKYLCNKNISIEVNTLSAIAPQNVGIFEQIITSQETASLHHVRLVKLLPSDAPKFLGGAGVSNSLSDSTNAPNSSLRCNNNFGW
jgi:hypothetical protein